MDRIKCFRTPVETNCFVKDNCILLSAPSIG